MNYQRKRQWDKVYDMLYDARGLSKEEYVRQRRAYEFADDPGPVKFDPDEVTFFNPESGWMILGCGLWRKGGHRKNLWTGVYAKFQNGEWYFTEVDQVMKQTPDDPDPCADAGK